MLLDYEFNNFTVFKNTTKFNMYPGRTSDRFQDNVLQIHSKMKLSRIAVIVGENGSGKTNFMKSLHYLRFLINDNNGIRTITRLCNNYNKKKSQQFRISALIEKKIYEYELELDEHSVVFEKFSFRGYTLEPSKNQTIFSRKKTHTALLDNEKINISMSVEINSKFLPKEFKNILNERNKTSDGLFLNEISIFNIEEVDIFKNWIKNRLIIDIPSDISLNVYKQFQKNEEDIEIIKNESFFEIFQLVDSSILNIEIDKKDPFRETKLVRKKNNKLFKVPLKYESSGINEFFAWSIQIWKVIYQDVILFADELDKVLNPILSTKVLRFIKGSDHKGQFIFSTHNILHLNTNDFMKEQIYFVSKDAYTIESELYSLSEFKDYSYEKRQIYDIYLKGLLGGVPND